MNRSGVRAHENLGRRLFSRRQARAAQGIISRARLRRAFLPEPGEQTFSIDRLSIADMQHVTMLAQQEVTNREGSFRGWACLDYAAAASDGRAVVASPTEENPYHGDIVLPASTVMDKGEREQHASSLADAATWCAPTTGGEIAIH